MRPADARMWMGAQTDWIICGWPPGDFLPM
jgi:hypothetical protein